MQNGITQYYITLLIITDALKCEQKFNVVFA